MFDTGSGLMVMVTFSLADVDDESVAVYSNTNLPMIVGVHEIARVSESKVRPSGKPKSASRV